MRALAGALVIAVFAINGCATVPDQGVRMRIAEAVRLQNDVIGDPLFREIFLDLDAAGAVIWEPNSLTARARAEASSHPSRTVWLLDRYAIRGGFAPGVITTWRKWNPWSRTTATTVAGRDATRLNSWRLGADARTIAPTLVHERVHSFGQTHSRSQYKQDNQCDAAYIAGDLAQALLARGNPGPISAPDVCPALCEALRSRNLPTYLECPVGR